jgi:hypothetical protein
MQSVAADQQFLHAQADSRVASWVGRILSSLAVAFLLFDSAGKILQVQPVIDATQQLGYSPDIVFRLGVTLLTSVLLYLWPRTSGIGAVLLTAYLGGAVASHVRIANPIFTHILFPTYLAAFLWIGLVLRNRRLRVILPWQDGRQS